ncbi:MraY family glycosyltransferase [Chengkuizengella sediminis]|uniref:MraY family glycosyltransferase n=1 Tax=Chengkuizengella sediminis TaxID=1885917 RepID=UPI001389EF69|nr:MraY family glycosyltransferase [Chengkuizengella sediminis]NDI34777.1 undecaprenyl/decaprenyl-phosphate alpha-N-acetylglucosaminyl 1-phosphate transferase [Chengkuizengella sediminis]
MVYIFATALVIAIVLSFVMTPFVRKFAILVGAVDQPNQRKVHTSLMPRLGGLAIYSAFVMTLAIMLPILVKMGVNVQFNAVFAILIGGSIIVLVGAFDDKIEISPKVKLLGQIIAACIVVFVFDLKVSFLTLPFGEAYNINGWLSTFITLFWIVGVTNAINLIDGLDGLAAGVSAIATATLLVLAIMMGNVTVIILSCLLLGSILGFLYFNFHPAKIFMGDSGSLFLGFALATLSILGFKQAAIVSFIVPLIILGVPLSDTFFAIVRRIVKKAPISMADKSHLHHCLLQVGLTHRQTVLAIYGIAITFGFSAIILSQASLWILILTAVVSILLIMAAQKLGLIQKREKTVFRSVVNMTTQLLGLKS